MPFFTARSGGTARIGVSAVRDMSCGSGEGRSALRTRGILAGFKTAGFRSFGRETQYETGFACIWESSLILRQRGVHRSHNSAGVEDVGLSELGEGRRVDG